MLATLPSLPAVAAGAIDAVRPGRPRAGPPRRRTFVSLLAILAILDVRDLLLLVGAGLLLRSFVGLVTADRGYDAANVVTAVTRNPDFRPRPAGMTPRSWPKPGPRTSGSRTALVEAVTGLERLPDVEAVGVTSRIPLAVTDAAQLRTQFRVAGRPVASNAADIPQASVQVVSPGYLEAMRLRLRAGRPP